jgi:hypothetical protein
MAKIDSQLLFRAQVSLQIGEKRKWTRGDLNP